MPLQLANFGLLAIKQLAGVKADYIQGAEGESGLATGQPGCYAGSLVEQCLTNTLKENGMKELDKISDISTRLIVNKASLKTRSRLIAEITDALK